MRHQLKGFKLGRTTSHRRATLAALTQALLRHKRIQTTHVKAKALRMYAEPLINRAKEDTTANRRLVFSHLMDKESVKELFGPIALAIGERPGGYTRIVKLGQRPGDGTEMAVIELVDFNTTGDAATGTTTRRRRTRRSAPKPGPKQQGMTSTPGAARAEAPDDTPAAEAVTPDTPIAENDTPDQTSEVSAQAPGTPLDSPEATSGGPAENPETGAAGQGGESRLP